jgi:hypothetical protein
MGPALGKPLAVQGNEIANIIGYQYPASLVRCLQLSVVTYSTQPEFIRSFGFNAVLLERFRERVGLAILVQMDSDPAHNGLRGRDRRRVRRPSA